MATNDLKGQLGALKDKVRGSTPAEAGTLLCEGISQMLQANPSSEQDTRDIAAALQADAAEIGVAFGEACSKQHAGQRERERT